MTKPESHFRIRSFVRRDSRRTKSQEQATADLWPRFGLDIERGMLDLTALFERDAPTYLEIGFGSGQSLLELARLHPEFNLIGVETHQPGIGALFIGVQNENLTNLRIFHADAIDVLEKCIPNESLAGTQVFFPDPWQKRRHHARRLVQTTFLDLLISKVKPKGDLHFATDWEDYAIHMEKTLSSITTITALSHQPFTNRSVRRPVITKFENRALREGRRIFDFQYQKN